MSEENEYDNYCDSDDRVIVEKLDSVFPQVFHAGESMYALIDPESHNPIARGNGSDDEFHGYSSDEVDHADEDDTVHAAFHKNCNPTFLANRGQNPVEGDVESLPDSSMHVVVSLDNIVQVTPILPLNEVQEKHSDVFGSVNTDNHRRSSRQRLTNRHYGYGAEFEVWSPTSRRKASSPLQGATPPTKLPRSSGGRGRGKSFGQAAVSDASFTDGSEAALPHIGPVARGGGRGRGRGRGITTPRGRGRGRPRNSAVPVLSDDATQKTTPQQDNLQAEYSSVRTIITEPYVGSELTRDSDDVDSGKLFICDASNDGSMGFANAIPEDSSSVVEKKPELSFGFEPIASTSDVAVDRFEKPYASTGGSRRRLRISSSSSSSSSESSESDQEESAVPIDVSKYYESEYEYRGENYPLFNCEIVLDRISDNQYWNVLRSNRIRAGKLHPPQKISSHNKSSAMAKDKRVKIKINLNEGHCAIGSSSSDQDVRASTTKSLLSSERHSIRAPKPPIGSILSQELRTKIEHKKTKKTQEDIVKKQCQLCATCNAEVADTVSGSIYCSDKCIDKQVEDSSRVFADPDVRVSIIENKTGRKLTGLSAPPLKLLSVWLKKHRAYLPVIPKSAQKSEADSTQPDNSPVPATQPESTTEMVRRLNVRRTLRDILVLRSKDAEDLLLSDDEIKKTALNIEAELYNFTGDIGVKYKERFHALYLQLKNPTNRGLFRKVLTGELSAWKFVRLTEPELTSKQYSFWQEPKTSKPDLFFTKRANTSVKRPLRPPVECDPLSSILDKMTTDTTHLHKSHLYDQNCKICTESKTETPPPRSVETAGHSSNKPSPTLSSSRLGSRDSIEQPVSPNADVKPVTVAPLPQEPAVPDPVFAPLPFTRDPLNLGAELPEGGGGSMSPNFKSENIEAMFMGYSQPERPPQPAPVESPSSSVATPLSYCHSVASSAQLPAMPPPPVKYSIQSLLWCGRIVMQDLFNLQCSAFHVSGPIEPIPQLTAELPKAFEVVGRIDPVDVFNYLRQIRKTAVKDIVVLQFAEPLSFDDNRQYKSLYDNMRLKNRFCVVGNCSKTMKDFYILPLGAHEQPPSALLPFDGPGLEGNQRNLLLGVIVKSRNVRTSPFTSAPIRTASKDLNPVNIPLSPENLLPKPTTLPDTSREAIREIINKRIQFIDNPEAALVEIVKAIGGHVNAEAQCIIVEELALTIRESQAAVEAASQEMLCPTEPVHETTQQFEAPVNNQETLTPLVKPNSESVPSASANPADAVQQQFMQMMMHMMTTMQTVAAPDQDTGAGTSAAQQEKSGSRQHRRRSTLSSSSSGSASDSESSSSSDSSRSPSPEAASKSHSASRKRKDSTSSESDSTEDERSSSMQRASGGRN